LDFDRAAHRVDDATELDDRPVAGPLDDSTTMYRDCGIDQVAPEGPEPRENAILVRARKPRVADHVGDQDRSELPDLAHDDGCRMRPIAGRRGFGMAAFPCCI
jgi:hypothetical protein